MIIDPVVWADQEKFNAELRAAHGQWPNNETFIKEMVLHLISECDELLRTVNWKYHRRPSINPDSRNTLTELIDIFKFWLTLVQGLGFTSDQVMNAYWQKSMVVRQRFSEEWIDTVRYPTVLVDIDGVLCDYVRGMLAFVEVHYPKYNRLTSPVNEIPAWVDNEWFGMTPEEWESVKHHFRTSGYKRTLPLMKGARQFIERLRERDYSVVLLTSRPIDRYPTLYGDTLEWVTASFGVGLPIWWAASKSDAIVIRRVRSKIAFAVDDDIHFVNQMLKIGVRTYWFKPQASTQTLTNYPNCITSFDEILIREDLA